MPQRSPCKLFEKSGKNGGGRMAETQLSFYGEAKTWEQNYRVTIDFTWENKSL
jgi:hypothetical protein